MSNENLNENYVELNSEDFKKEFKARNSDMKDELKSVKFPEHIIYRLYGDEKVGLRFKFQKQIGIKMGDTKASNMQEDEACFEAWATIIYTHYLKTSGKVELSAAFDIDPDWRKYVNHPHYGRFLYRALRFSQQYEWFSLDKSLESEVEKFDEYLKSKKPFINNSPKKECSKNTSGLEAFVESIFAKTNSPGNKSLKERLGLKNVEIYRQLPVGLFKNKKAATNQIFAHNKAAIDLWTIKDDIFYPIELKADNRKVGAITEIFFYSNYAFDLFIKTNDKASPFILDTEGNKRGYDQIKEQSKNLKKVRGFLLLDEANPSEDRKGSNHPLITDEVIDALNNTKHGSPDIEYGKILYTLAIRVAKDNN